jgi:hypothetical protein
MIKLPFGRKPSEQVSDRPSRAFADYCREELERARDSGDGFDEQRFRAAMELALERLRALERGEGQ